MTEIRRNDFHQCIEPYMLLLMRSLVRSHTTSLYVMPEVSPLTTCGDRLNRASSVFLDSPVKRLCHNVILRPKPKNLSLITHRFYEILHGVYPGPKSETLRFSQGDSGEGFRMTNLHFKVIAAQPPSRGMTRMWSYL